MDLRDIIQSEVNQTKTDTIWFHLQVKSKKQDKWINEQNKTITDS